MIGPETGMAAPLGAAWLPILVVFEGVDRAFGPAFLHAGAGRPWSQTRRRML